MVDVMLLEPPPPNGSLPLANYGTWYQQQSQFVRLGTPFWAGVPTQVAARTMDQMRGLGADLPLPLSLEPEQIRLLVYHAVASGARGVLFRSRSRLDQADRSTRLRARILECLNRELDVLEPWLASGTYEGEIDTGNPSVRVSMLKTDRSRLLLVIRRAVDQQFVVGPSNGRPITFEVHGVPETDEAYRIATDGLHKLSQERGTGVRVTLRDAQTTSAIVFTQDRLTINFLARKLGELHKRRSQLVAEIAADWYASVAETHRKLAGAIPVDGPSATSLERARSDLQHFQHLLDEGGHVRAAEHYRRGFGQLAATRYHDWKQAVRSFEDPVASPLCVSYFALPYHYALAQRLLAAGWGPNALAGGDFESLPHMQSSGWRHRGAEQPDAESTVELSLHQPRSGRSSLRIRCRPKDRGQAPLVLDSPPVTITSAAIPAAPGQLFRIHGWVRVPAPVQSSLDGLLI
jgi:hypothetical protein